MKFSPIFCALLFELLCTVICWANPYKPLSSGTLIQDKNFYLFTLFEEIPECREVIRDHKQLAALLEQRKLAISESAENSQENTKLHVDAFLWTEEEIRTISDVLKELCSTNNSLSKLVTNHMRSSRFFENYSHLSNADLIAKAWNDAAQACNRILRIYALGEPPMYDQFDRISYDPKDPIYRKLININTAVIDHRIDVYDMFFQPSMEFSRYLLINNERDECERYEPLEENENTLCFERVKKIDWDEYAYASILIPGAGPDLPNIRIDPWARMRMIIAVDLYRRGLAPFIIASGGHVKPFPTPFSEGLEMKKILIEEHHIPEDAIILEPYARHTTTNLRNAARLMYRYGFPMDKKSIVTTDQYQSRTIGSEKFKKRCFDELGFLPVQIGKRLSKFDIEFTPNLVSMHLDANDPLDP